MTRPVGPDTFRALTEAAESGDLFLDPGATESCVHACDRFLEVLVHIQESCAGLKVSEAFGYLPSARSLGLKFDAKAIGEGGLHQVLQTHIDTVTRMREMFATAGRAYLETDAETLAALRKTNG